MKKILSLILLVIITSVVFSGCISDKTNNISEESSDITVSNTDESELSSMNYVKNSDTKDMITNFFYIWDTDIDQSLIKKCKSKDAVTIYLKNHVNTESKEWLVDIKSGKIYHGVAPYRFYEVSDYSYSRNLSQKEINDIIISLDKAGTQSWEKNYTGTDKGTGSFSWSVKIEYNNGVIESHSGSGMSAAPPSGYYAIKSLLESLCEQE